MSINIHVQNEEQSLEILRKANCLGTENLLCKWQQLLAGHTTQKDNCYLLKFILYTELVNQRVKSVRWGRPQKLHKNSLFEMLWKGQIDKTNLEQQTLNRPSWPHRYSLEVVPFLVERAIALTERVQQGKNPENAKDTGLCCPICKIASANKTRLVTHSKIRPKRSLRSCWNWCIIHYNSLLP